MKLFKNDGERRAGFYTGLVDAHRDRLLKFARARILNDSDAEDVVQEALYVAWRRIDVLMVSPNPVGWLYNALKFCVKKYYESEKAKDIAMPELWDEAVFPEIDGDWGVAALLTEDELRIVNLKYQGYTHHEIAKMLDAPYGTIASKVSRIKAKIMKLLDGGV
jgi:DNA-directed RNA polymerase specialized sigma24 family protein